ncbi:transposase [Arcobacter venerupis]|uniref:transposase n=1 Tax=Arcobacter venerupis TaxID=1054033 RepID=UPI0026BE2005
MNQILITDALEQIKASEFELDIPRDRNGSFEPQIVKKHQTHISEQIEEKILSLYGLGNSYQQIDEHIEELYGLEFSKATISPITGNVIIATMSSGGTSGNI